MHTLIQLQSEKLYYSLYQPRCDCQKSNQRGTARIISLYTTPQIQIYPHRDQNPTDEAPIMIKKKQKEEITSSNQPNADPPHRDRKCLTDGAPLTIFSTNNKGTQTQTKINYHQVLSGLNTLTEVRQQNCSLHAPRTHQQFALQTWSKAPIQRTGCSKIEILRHF